MRVLTCVEVKVGEEVSVAAGRGVEAQIGSTGGVSVGWARSGEVDIGRQQPASAIESRVITERYKVWLGK